MTFLELKKLLEVYIDAVPANADAGFLQCKQAAIELKNSINKDTQTIPFQPLDRILSYYCDHIKSDDEMGADVLKKVFVALDNFSGVRFHTAVGEETYYFLPSTKVSAVKDILGKIHAKDGLKIQVHLVTPGVSDSFQLAPGPGISLIFYSETIQPFGNVQVHAAAVQSHHYGEQPRLPDRTFSFQAPYPAVAAENEHKLAEQKTYSTQTIERAAFYSISEIQEQLLETFAANANAALTICVIYREADETLCRLYQIGTTGIVELQKGGYICDLNKTLLRVHKLSNEKALLGNSALDSQPISNTFILQPGSEIALLGSDLASSYRPNNNTLQIHEVAQNAAGRENATIIKTENLHSLQPGQFLMLGVSSGVQTSHGAEFIADHFQPIFHRQLADLDLLEILRQKLIKTLEPYKHTDLVVSLSSNTLSWGGLQKLKDRIPAFLVAYPQLGVSPILKQLHDLEGTYPQKRKEIKAAISKIEALAFPHKKIETNLVSFLALLKQNEDALKIPLKEVGEYGAYDLLKKYAEELLAVTKRANPFIDGEIFENVVATNRRLCRHSSQEVLALLKGIPGKLAENLAGYARIKIHLPDGVKTFFCRKDMPYSELKIWANTHFNAKLEVGETVHSINMIGGAPADNKLLAPLRAEEINIYCQTQKTLSGVIVYSSTLEKHSDDPHYALADRTLAFSEKTSVVEEQREAKYPPRQQAAAPPAENTIPITALAVEHLLKMTIDTLCQKMNSPAALSACAIYKTQDKKVKASTVQSDGSPVLLRRDQKIKQLAAGTIELVDEDEIAVVTDGIKDPVGSLRGIDSLANACARERALPYAILGYSRDDASIVSASRFSSIPEGDILVLATADGRGSSQTAQYVKDNFQKEFKIHLENKNILAFYDLYSQIIEHIKRFDPSGSSAFSQILKKYVPGCDGCDLLELGKLAERVSNKKGNAWSLLHAQLAPLKDINTEQLGFDEHNLKIMQGLKLTPPTPENIKELKEFDELYSQIIEHIKCFDPTGHSAFSQILRDHDPGYSALLELGKLAEHWNNKMGIAWSPLYAQLAPLKDINTGKDNLQIMREMQLKPPTPEDISVLKMSTALQKIQLWINYFSGACDEIKEIKDLLANPITLTGIFEKIGAIAKAHKGLFGYVRTTALNQFFEQLTILETLPKEVQFTKFSRALEDKMERIEKNFRADPHEKIQGLIKDQDKNFMHVPMHARKLPRQEAKMK